MGNLKIEYLPVDEIKPYEKNARKHGGEDVQAIVNSIKEFGFDDPIGVWGKENVIVEGHGRLEAAKKLGMESVPVIHLDHLTDEQRRAYALAHNKTSELSEWDIGTLPDELSNIFDIDMSEFGFDLEKSVDEDLNLSLEEKSLNEYQYIHYLVTIGTDEESKYKEIIDKIKSMGAEVKETKNNT